MLGFQALCAGSALAGGVPVTAVPIVVGGDRIVGGIFTRGRWLSIQEARQLEAQRKRRKRELEEIRALEALELQAVLRAAAIEQAAREGWVALSALGFDNAIEALTAAETLRNQAASLAMREFNVRLKLKAEKAEEDDDEEALALLFEDELN